MTETKQYEKETNFKDAVKEVDAVPDVLGGQMQKDSCAVLRPGGILIATRATALAGKSRRTRRSPPIRFYAFKQSSVEK